MATVTLYTFEGGARGSRGDDGDTYSTFDYEEAKARARQYGLAVVANEYEWSDSELLEDFRPAAADDDDFDAFEMARVSQESQTDLG